MNFSSTIRKSYPGQGPGRLCHIQIEMRPSNPVNRQRHAVDLSSLVATGDLRLEDLDDHRTHQSLQSQGIQHSRIEGTLIANSLRARGRAQVSIPLVSDFGRSYEKDFGMERAYATLSLEPPHLSQERPFTGLLGGIQALIAAFKPHDPFDESNWVLCGAELASPPILLLQIDSIAIGLNHGIGTFESLQAARTFAKKIHPLERGLKTEIASLIEIYFATMSYHPTLIGNDNVSIPDIPERFLQLLATAHGQLWNQAMTQECREKIPLLIKRFFQSLKASQKATIILPFSRKEGQCNLIIHAKKTSGVPSQDPRFVVSLSLTSPAPAHWESLLEVVTETNCSSENPSI